jgi:hypothetical protein
LDLLEGVLDVLDVGFCRIYMPSPRKLEKKTLVEKI